MNRLAAALLPLALVGLVACGVSPSPISPTVSPASLLTSSETRDASPALHASRPTTRDAIVIDRGELDLSPSGGALSLSGTRGFSFSGSVSRSGGIVDAFDACVAASCVPGAPISLRAAWSGTDLPGSITLDGLSYPQVGSLANSMAAAVEFSGAVLAPPLTDRGTLTAVAPFTLRGQFVHPDNAGLLVTELFTGAGVARVYLTNNGAGGGWSVERVVYRLRHQS